MLLTLVSAIGLSFLTIHVASADYQGYIALLEDKEYDDVPSCLCLSISSIEILAYSVALLHKPDVRLAEKHFLDLNHGDMMLFSELILDLWQPYDFLDPHGMPHSRSWSSNKLIASR